MVLFDRITEELTAHKITANNVKGAYQATAHLITTGHSKIAHLSSKSSLTMTSERFEGYKQALADHQIAYTEKLVQFCDTTDHQYIEENLSNSMVKLLEQQPDAIFAATDLLSIKALEYLNQNNYSIPNGIALIGFSNSELAAMLNPSLSTVRQPSRQIGELAAQTLINLVKGKDIGPAETVLLDTELQIRKSSSR